MEETNVKTENLVIMKDDDNKNGAEIVNLYIYDLTQGLASVMSSALLGRHIEGVWHTAVVVFGKEYFYGGHGISCCTPGTTVLGQPNKIEKIGETFVPYQIFKDYLRGLAESTFKGSQYNLLSHNCNTFSEDLCQFLCGTSIPRYILDLPQEFLSTPLGQSIAPLIASIDSNNSGTNTYSFEPQITSREISPGFEDLNNEIEEVRAKSQLLEERRQTIQDKLAKKDKKKDKKKKKILNGYNNCTDGCLDNNKRIIDNNISFKSNISDYQNSTSTNSTNRGEMSEVEQEMNGDGAGVVGLTKEIHDDMLPSEKYLEDEAKDRAKEEERKKNLIPPIVFHNIDPKNELEQLVKFVDGKLTKEEETSIEELHQYLIEGEGSWALGDNFLAFVGRVLREPDLSPDTRVHLIRALAAGALKDDIILLLHQDRRDHTLMNYSQDIDRHTPEEQQAWALFICNLFENTSPSEWLLYISEWTYRNQQISNIRGTTKVAVHCLLATCPTLQDIGTAIIYNLGIKEVKTVVFDDVVVELAMAILQFLNTKPSEEHLFRVMMALSRFMTVSPDVPQLVEMIGPNPKTFKGTSQRIDEIIEIISQKVH